MPRFLVMDMRLAPRNGQIPPTRAEVVDRAGECGRLAGPGTGLILNRLGSGQPLGEAIREAIGGAPAAHAGPVHIHTGRESEQFAEWLGAEAFAVGRHIVFARGRFNVESENGVRLLRHELAHVVAEHGREDTVNCWFTTADRGRQFHGLRSVSGAPVVGPLGTEPPEVNVGTDPNVTHRDLTIQALRIGGFGSTSQGHLLDWVEKIDRFKGDRWSSVLTAFPQLRPYSERLVHSWRGESEASIGMTSTDLSSARCASRGVVGTLLREAVAHFNGGTYKDHALKMLGVSLHTIQDFYSHRVDIYDARYHQTLELRAYAEACGVIVFKMEDDPKIAPERWHTAKLRTEDQLRAFKTMVNAADLAAF